MLYDQDDLKVTFTHKCGPAPTFCWPQRENICWSRQKASSVDDIYTITGRNYTIGSDIESLMIKLQKNLTRCRHKLRKLVVVISRTLKAFLPKRRYASAGYRDRNVSVRLSVRHAPVLCQNEES